MAPNSSDRQISIFVKVLFVIMVANILCCYIQNSLVVRFAHGNVLPTYLCFSQASRSTWCGGIAGTHSKAVLRRRVDSSALVPFRGAHLHIVVKREHQAWSKKKGKKRHVFGGEGWDSQLSTVLTIHCFSAGIQKRKVGGVEAGVFWEGETK